jgi:hypothetical protein
MRLAVKMTANGVTIRKGKIKNAWMAHIAMRSPERINFPSPMLEFDLMVLKVRVRF